jgi:phosphoglycolate phosphatase
MELKKIQAALFDLDGTLIDTLEDISDAMNSVLMGHGFPSHSYEAYKYFIGHGIRRLVERALPENMRGENWVSRCYNEMIAAYQQNYMHKTRIYDGIGEALQAFREEGLRLAVFSNKAHELTLPLVHALFGKQVFEVVLGARQGFPAKPAPDGALFIAKEMALLPGQFIYIGDTHTDMETALAAGMFPVGALWGYRTEEELKSSGAKQIVSHPLNLTGLLQKNR